MDIDLGSLTGLSESNKVTVYRGDSPKYYNESRLWAHIRNEINASGLFDVIKKCPEKDGHMLSDPYYIRERKGEWCLCDNQASIRKLQEDFNAGSCILTLIKLT